MQQVAAPERDAALRVPAHARDEVAVVVEDRAQLGARLARRGHRERAEVAAGLRLAHREEGRLREPQQWGVR